MMLAQMKRAEAFAPTLVSSRLAGRININPTRMELMMQANTMPGGAPATQAPTLVTIWVDRSKPGNPGEAQKWSSSLDGVPLVTRHRDIEHASCRALVKLGRRGRVEFIHAASGVVGISMNIERGAGLSTSEDDRGLRTVKYTAFPDTRLRKEGDEDRPGTEVPSGDLEPSFGATIAEAAMLIGGAS
jgi:hypothetical protein